MGLDMYLKKKTFIWSDGRDKLKISGVNGIKPERVNVISEEIGYWRKANAIHRWFVENCQEGVDECQEVYVPQEKLEELLELCEEVISKTKMKEGQILMGTTYKKGKEIKEYEDGEVIANPEIAENLLPIQEGFFFGSQSYDKYYLETLKDTVKVIKQALNETNGDFYYQSSW